MAAGRIDSRQTARLTTASARPGAFGAADRLHHRTEFLQVQRLGVRFVTEHFVMYGLTRPDRQRSSLGVTVSRKVGSAVVRNRIRRRIRETFRLYLRTLIAPGTALVVIAKPGSGGLQTPQIRRELSFGAGRIAQKLERPSA